MFFIGIGKLHLNYKQEKILKTLNPMTSRSIKLNRMWGLHYTFKPSI